MQDPIDMFCKNIPNNEILRIVVTHLKRNRLNVTSVEGRYRLSAGITNINSIYQAFQEGEIRVEENGSISLCGESIHPRWDTARIRRRVEDYLRKSASTADIIKTANCLGVSITS